jgi:hypothetical protein
MSQTSSCQSCFGSGEAATDFGVVDCPDCGGAGFLPSKNVLIDWRARDIEQALARGRAAEASDVHFLLSELRSARKALTEIIALAHDAQDPDLIAQRIRFAANRALGLYEVGDATDAPHSQASSTPTQ